MITLSCIAGYGSGGLGRHLSELVEAHRSSNTLHRYFTRKARDVSDPLAETIRLPLTDLLLRMPFIRSSQGRSQFLSMDAFDAAVAGRLDAGAKTHIGFCGQALRTFRRAGEVGYASCELVAPTCHLDYVARQHQAAYSAYPLEDGWLNRAHHRKGVAEYERADRIHVVSDYVRHSFLTRGVPEAKLVRAHLCPRAPVPAVSTRVRIDDGVFRFVYIGMLTVTKGVPLLVDALAQLPQNDIELVLVGGTGSRGMRNFVDRAMKRDRRIRLAPGDPMPVYETSDCCVHPSYQDGFAYAVGDAIAMGLPVIVSEDTGSKELLNSEDSGIVVPTGNLGALVDAMRTMYQRGRRHGGNG